MNLNRYKQLQLVVLGALFMMNVTMNAMKIEYDAEEQAYLEKGTMPTKVYFGDTDFTNEEINELKKIYKQIKESTKEALDNICNQAESETVNSQNSGSIFILIEAWKALKELSFDIEKSRLANNNTSRIDFSEHTAFVDWREIKSKALANNLPPANQPSQSAGGGSSKSSTSHSWSSIFSSLWDWLRALWPW
ncbi:hypothetical protein IPH25_04665 [bacterium]|nr:MAG: hypothetical protein IPG37_01660 [bacterium]QQR61734.1 MAG: hypothetical protein IPH25_04665 [bacterium]QQR62698.1 MAG: hypothetical protein IPH67_04770 [bacterium]